MHRFGNHASVPDPEARVMRIHQLLPSLGYGDAVAHQAIAIRDRLRGEGHLSDLFALDRHPRSAATTRSVVELAGEEGAVTIYHHAYWSEDLEAVMRQLPGRLVLVYHNVTPAEFLRPYGEALGATVAQARRVLSELLPRVDVPLAVSPFNARELQALGYRNVGLLPLVIDARPFEETTPSAEVLSRYADGRTNLLFVGRLTPSKRQEDVVRIFAWYRRFVDPSARLLLVGAAPEVDAYPSDLAAVVDSFGLRDAVVFSGKVSFSELVAYYRVADAFVCMSEHEGFCVPLIEAMLHDVPVIARATAAIPETLGGAGVLFEECHVPQIAQAIGRLLSDRDMRAAVLETQRRRAAEFGPEAFARSVDRLVAAL
jgi:glycosyltransferase involved in cell wall biosynthesis